MSALPRRWSREDATVPIEIEGFEDMTFLFNYRGAKTDGLIWMNHDEAALLWKWARRVRPGTTIVEIGRAEGGSTILIAAARRSQDTKIVSIDLHPVDDGQLDALLKELKLENVEVVVADSQSFDVATVGDVGLVFIDADHTYAGVKRDFENWLPAVIQHGFIVFHDVRDAGMQNYGPLELYGELQSDKRVVEIAAAGSVRVMIKL